MNLIKRSVASFTLFTLIAGVVVGCGDKSKQQANNNAAPAAVVAPLPVLKVPGTCLIEGRAILDGKAPAMKVIGNGCIPGAPPLKDESIVVGKDNGLANVIVYLKDVKAAPAPSTQPVVLDQMNCRFDPHVLAMQAGQTLRIHSSDNVLHNVHLISRANPEQNFGEHQGEQHDIIEQYPEEPFLVQCDVHPWMKAWIGVFNHPYFAVTAPDGSFTIHNVPPGHYTLVAWQEVLDQQEKPVEVTADKTVKMDFHFKAQ